MLLIAISAYSFKIANTEFDLFLNTEGYMNSTTADSLTSTLNEGTFYYQEIGTRFKTEIKGFDITARAAIRITNDKLYNNSFELNNILLKIKKNKFFLELGKVYVRTTRNGFNYSVTGGNLGLHSKFGDLNFFAGNIWDGRDGFRFDRWGAGGIYALRLGRAVRLSLYANAYSDKGTFISIPERYQKITGGIIGGGELNLRFGPLDIRANTLYSSGSGDITGDFAGISSWGRVGLRSGPLDVMFEAGYVDKEYVSPTRLGLSGNSFITSNTRFHTKRSSFNVLASYREYYDSFRSMDYFSTVLNTSFSIRGERKLRFSNYFTIKHAGDGSFSMWADRVGFATDMKLIGKLFFEPDLGISYEHEKVSGFSDNLSLNAVMYFNTRLLSGKETTLNLKIGLTTRYGYYFNSKTSSYNILPVGQIDFRLKRIQLSLSSNYLSSVLNKSPSNALHSNGRINFYIDKNMTNSVGAMFLYINESYTDTAEVRTEYQVKLMLSLTL